MSWNGSVPVIMYHSVLPKRYAWGAICTPYELFEQQIEELVSQGFVTVSLNELIQYMKGEISLNENSIALTFDDGYLDNWIYVYPLLKKHGYTATIFPSFEFIPTGKIRTRDNCNEEFNLGAYLNTSELKYMYNSGVFDIQSHTMTHTWYPKNSKIVNLYTPKNRVPWVEWNLNPNSKKKWNLGSHFDSKLLGYPIAQNNRALGVYKYQLSEQYISAFQKEYQQIPIKCTSSIQSTIKQLSLKFAEKLKGKYETKDEFNSRVDYELGNSSDEIFSITNRTPNIICWPGGAKHPDIGNKWQKHGYTTLTRAAGTIHGHTNAPGDNPAIISRIGSGSLWSRGSKYISYFDKHAIVYFIKKYQGHSYANSLIYCNKLKLLFSNKRVKSELWGNISWTN